MIANSGLYSIQISTCKIRFWTCIYKSRDGFLSLQALVVSQPGSGLSTTALPCHGGWCRPGCPLHSPAALLLCWGHWDKHWSPGSQQHSQHPGDTHEKPSWQEWDPSHDTKSGKVLTEAIRRQETLPEAFHLTSIWRLTYSNNTGKHLCSMNLEKSSNGK